MSTTKDDYAFTRDAKDSDRLDAQHEIYTKSLGYLLHPSIVEKLPPNPRIADLGCGTGKVSRDLSVLFPNAKLDAFDISDAQFPKDQGDLPSISFHVADVKQPLPQQFHGKFDIVLLRLLAIVLAPTDYPLVARHACQLLKPGGAVQWVEPGYTGIIPVLRDDVTATTKNLHKAINTALQLPNFDRLAYDFAKLVPILQEAGMADVEQDVVSSDRVVALRTASTINCLVSACGAAKMSGGHSQEELSALERDGQKDIDSGAYVRWPIYCTIGFRA